jgi:hypothetical protein
MEYIKLGVRIQETLHSDFCEQNRSHQGLVYVPTEHCNFCKAFYAGYDQGFYEGSSPKK